MGIRRSLSTSFSGAIISSSGSVYLTRHRDFVTTTRLLSAGLIYYS